MPENPVVRGEVYNVNLEPTRGSEEGGFRPAVIIQNDRGNQFSPTTVVIPLSSKDPNLKLLHIPIPEDAGLYKDSVALVEHIRTIDTSRIGSFITRLDDKTMKKIEEAILYLLDIK